MASPQDFPGNTGNKQEYRQLSDEEFAGLSTVEKLTYVNLGMRKLTEALLEMADSAAAARAGKSGSGQIY